MDTGGSLAACAEFPHPTSRGLGCANVYIEPQTMADASTGGHPRVVVVCGLSTCVDRVGTAIMAGVSARTGVIHSVKNIYSRGEAYV